MSFLSTTTGEPEALSGIVLLLCALLEAALLPFQTSPHLPYEEATLSSTLKGIALNPQPGERVLEIGTGSGYQTAVLAQLTGEVYTVEVVPELAGPARERLTRLGYHNVHFRVGDGSAGWPEAEPFDAIIGTAAPERLPPALYQQLRPGGRLVLPVGPRHGAQELVRVTRPLRGEEPQVEKLLAVRFVPMTSAPPSSYPH